MFLVDVLQVNRLYGSTNRLLCCIPVLVKYVICIFIPCAAGVWALVNNAAVNFVGDVEFCTMEQYKHIAEVNQFGVIRMTKAFLPLIRKSKGRFC